VRRPSEGTRLAPAPEPLEARRGEWLGLVRAAPDRAALEALRVRLLGRKGELTRVLRALKERPPAERAHVGAVANRLKQELEASLAARQAELEAAQEEAGSGLDVTLPGRRPWIGRTHVLHQVRDDLLGVFESLGFGIYESPEVEDDRHNFTALNLPPGHPAREGHDTYYLENGRLLRTHTSPGWVRAMEASEPPLRIVTPGRVYRAEAIDATHMDQFHQIDGACVGERVTLAELRSTLVEAARRLFGPAVRTRFVPLYFPFTEPSAQVDVTCILCGGTGRLADARCPICKETGWLEILGSGMIHPAVFRAVGYDPERVTGYAFGIGVERLALLRHRIPDIRYFLESDHRFLARF
jgi:phenylalanyl-tRNA synthetase alpha chain